MLAGVSLQLTRSVTFKATENRNVGFLVEGNIKNENESIQKIFSCDLQSSEERRKMKIFWEKFSNRFFSSSNWWWNKEVFFSVNDENIWIAKKNVSGGSEWSFQENCFCLCEKSCWKWDKIAALETWIIASLKSLFTYLLAV